MVDKLSDARQRINFIDDQVIGLLKQRFEVVREISEIKKSNGNSVYDPKREEEIINRLQAKSGLHRVFIEKIYYTIFDYSKAMQNKKEE